MSRSTLSRRRLVRSMTVLTSSLALALGGASATALADEGDGAPAASQDADDPDQDDEQGSDDEQEGDEDGDEDGDDEQRAEAGDGFDPVAGVDEVVVAVQPGTDVAALAAEYGLTVTDQLAGSADTYLLQAPPGSDVVDLAARLESDRRTRFAEPNFATGAPEANPTYRWGLDAGPQPAGADPSLWNRQPALTQVQATGDPAAGTGVTVAVLDTGVSAGHPSLAGRLAGPGVDLIDGDTLPDDAANGVDDDGDGRVDEAAGHGTHVAGVVLAVAPDAQILPVRVLDSDGRGSIFALAEGIRIALDSGADVLNLSLGTTEDSELLADALEEVSEDTVVVASAGNTGTQELQYPAATGGVVSVASVDAGDGLSVFSNRGWVDVAAPGEDIVSTFPGGGFATWAGTSMAAPFVAGQAAVLLPLLGEDAAGRVPGVIESTAVPGDPQIGAGRIDVAASLRAAGSSTTGD